MEYTTNYHLPQWVETDRIQMKDFNQMCADIESGLDSANSTAAAVQTQLGGELAALASAMGSGGSNCRIAWGSYTGRGTIGAANANRLDFGFQPVLVVIGSNEEATRDMWPSIFLRNITKTKNEVIIDSPITVTWTATGLSWYTTSDNPNYPGWYQNNVNGRTYYYCAIGYSNS